MEKKVESKKEEMKEEVEHLKSLLQKYSPGSDSMHATLEKAAISRTGPEQNADVKIVAAGAKKPSDSFTLIWSVANHRHAQIEIRADVDGNLFGLRWTTRLCRTVRSMPHTQCCPIQRKTSTSISIRSTICL
jgi:hypothetical protein